MTRSDVAKAAGTSVAVVSYVINNGPRPVAEATRQRVLAAIQQTGYRPNAVARALASGSTKTFGLIVPNIANPFVASMAHVLLQESLNHGHVMLLVIAWLLNQRVADGVDYHVDIELRPGATRGKTWRYRTPLRLDVGVPADAGALVHVMQNVNNPLLLEVIEQTFNGLKR
ncbi:hypothetical protein E05_35010 [Plautia stali symbiont]|nr:hypothetical protein E05_35010 [Plautia stali symbiont]